MDNLFFPNNEIKRSTSKQEIHCFGVDTLASSFVESLDDIVKSPHENVCLIAIFGTWGRGKTYFFKRVKNILLERNDERDEDSCFFKNKNKKVKYDIVEFNAWKYQETPALWAHLYETFKLSLSWFDRCVLFFKENILQIIRIVLLPLFVMCSFSVFEIITRQELSFWLKIIMSIIPFFERGARYLYENKEKFKIGKIHVDTLGYQNIIEKDLEVLLGTKIFKKKTDTRKVILYIDDLDRCKDEKIISVIESLRTILENEEIKKRLIIICSLDKERIQSSISQKYNIDRGINSYKIKEQLDKLFVFSIVIPKLSIGQQIGYLETFSKNYANNTITSLVDITREDSSMIQFLENTKEKKVTEVDLIEYLKRYIRSKETEFTPRQINVLYNRLIFVNKLLSKYDNTLIINDVIEEIIEKSYSEQTKNETKKAFSDIVEVVVAY